MQCLQQVAVPVGIGITTYDCRKPCEFWPVPEREGITLPQDLKHFGTGPQIQPSLPKIKTAFLTFETVLTQDN